MDFHVINSRGRFHILSLASPSRPGPDEHAPRDPDRHAAEVQVAGGAVDAALAHQVDGAVDER
jgi:hypothetical protein